VRAAASILVGTLSFCVPEYASAQPLQQADLSGLVGWLNASTSELSSYDNWYNRSAYGSAIFGWYWTDHIKTELEVAISSPAEVYAARAVDIDGERRLANSEHRFSTRRVTAGQQYQFFRNAWAHPHVGAGVDLTWERHEERVDPVFVYDPVSRTSRALQDARTLGPNTDLQVRPFGEVGAKLYITPRAFFRTDLRMTFRTGIDEVVMRLGFGVDF
jgi:hypothetical protein